MRSKELVKNDLLKFKDLSENLETFKTVHKGDMKKPMNAGSTVNKYLLNGKPQGSWESFIVLK